MASQDIERMDSGNDDQSQISNEENHVVSAAHSPLTPLQREVSGASASRRWSTLQSSSSVKRKPVGSGHTLSVKRKPVPAQQQPIQPEPEPVKADVKPDVKPTSTGLQPMPSGDAVVSNIQRVLQVQADNLQLPPTTELAIQKLYYDAESPTRPEEQWIQDSYRGIAARIVQEPESFMEVRNLVLNASDAEILKLLAYLKNNNLYAGTEDKEAMDWVDLIEALRANGPFSVMRVLPERLTNDHHLWAGVAKTILLDSSLTTKAQYHSVEPSPNAPINKSFFKTTRIPFSYDGEEYQKNFEYRYWTGERTLGLTDTTTLETYRAELERRYRNRKKLLQPFVPEPFDDSYAEISYNNQLRATKNFQRLQRMAENADIELNTTGWTRNPGLIGPPINASHDGYPKLPEMHTGVAGEHYPDGSIYIVQTHRWPMARNWTTLSELVWFPLSLPRVLPLEFRDVENPEMLFTDRFGVTMRGVAQTPKCTSNVEHDISTRSIADTIGYDATLASHGITYADYRRCIVAILYILGREGDWLHQRRDLKEFFYEATQYLRMRGVPVVIKFKFELETPRGTIMWAATKLSIRHHPFSVPIRGRLGKR